MNNNFRYQGEYESKKKQNIQETVEFILSKNYGSTLMHGELAHLLGYNIEDEEELKKYQSIMGRIKNFVLDYGYVLKGISGIGFYILKPSQVSKHCYRTYVKRAGRMYDKSAYILGRTEKENLDADRLEEIKNMIDLNKQLIDVAWNTVKESAYFSRKDYYDSLED